MATPELDTILQYMSDGFIAVDSALRVRTMNGAAETLLQQSATSLDGIELDDAVPDLAGSRAASEIRSIAAGRVARRVEHFAPSRYTWYEFHVVPRPDGLYLFVRNVTDRARQMQTEAVRATVRSILMDAPVAITITRGPEHRYELVNQRARQLVGGRDLEGRAARNAFPELADSPLFAILDEVFKTGTPYTGRNVPVTYDRAGDGQMYDGMFDITYQPLFEPDGRVWGILTIAVEVTDYVEARAQLEALRTEED